MVTTNVIDVLPDGTITEMELSVDNTLSIILKRCESDEEFKLINSQVLAHDEVSIKEAYREIAQTLKENGLDCIAIASVAGNQAVRIKL